MNLLTRSNIIIAILTLAVIIICFAKCENVRETSETSDLNNKIKEDKLDKDSIRERIVYKDRIRTEYVVKWKAIKSKVDSIPCPEALNEVMVFTDSIMVVDSSLISSLKAELVVDSLIIKNQDSLIVKQAILLSKKDKEIKKQKFLKRIWQGVSIALGITVIVK